MTSLSAVFISVLSGLIGGVDAGSVILRAIVVFLIFSLFAAGINLIAVQFLKSESSDTASSQENAPSQKGGAVNIVLSEDDEDISELPSESDDFQGDSDDDDEGVKPEKKSQLGERSRQVDTDMATSMDIDTLPDLGSFSSSFSTTSSDNEEKKTESEEETGYNENKSYSSVSRLSSEGIAGIIADRNSPEELAKAVKTVMRREETR